MAEDARTPAERKLQAKIAVNTSWAKTRDRAARTAAARVAADARFEKQVDPDGTMDPVDRAKAAESARTAHYQRMAAKSVATRRRRSRGIAG